MSLQKLFEALPPRKGNPLERLDIYEEVLAGCDRDAMLITVAALMKGELDDASRSFAPTPPELAFLIRRNQRTDYAGPGSGPYTPTPFVSLSLRVSALKERILGEGRRKLREVENHAQAQALAKNGKVPPGSLYVALLGAIYSPVRKPKGEAHE
jgi:hypothetical protein